MGKRRQKRPKKQKRNKPQSGKQTGIANEYASRHRKEPTPAEMAMGVILEEIQKDLRDLNFVFQKPWHYRQNGKWYFYILDYFLNPPYELAIEIDGKYHDGQATKDMWRDRNLYNAGVRTVRYTNEQVLDDPTWVGFDLVKRLAKMGRYGEESNFPKKFIWR